MKRIFFLLALVFTLGLSSIAFEAEAAKRMGSGKSMGMQRQSAPDKAPQANQAQNQAATPGAAAGAGAAAPSSRSWLGPVAGIAAGLGLAALASHLGFGDEMASMLMFGLLAAAIMIAVGFFMRKRAAAQQAAGRAGGMQYAPAGAQPSAPAAPAYKVAMPAAAGSSIGSSLIGSGAGAPSIPADFDVAGFERQAKVNFIRLQAANDAGNLDDIRQFTSPEIFAELTLDLADRGGATQHTDVLSIDAKVFEVVEEAGNYIVSVRFTGVLREASEAQSESVDEVWHLTKPLAGHGGWVLAGIEQL